MNIIITGLTVATGRLRSAAAVGNWRRKNAQIDRNADRSPLSCNWSRSNASTLMSPCVEWQLVATRRTSRRRSTLINYRRPLDADQLPFDTKARMSPAILRRRPPQLDADNQTPAIVADRFQGQPEATFTLRRSE